jgi:hypothetical protein
MHESGIVFDQFQDSGFLDLAAEATDGYGAQLLDELFMKHELEYGGLAGFEAFAPLHPELEILNAEPPFRLVAEDHVMETAHVNDVTIPDGGEIRGIGKTTPDAFERKLREVMTNKIPDVCIHDNPPHIQH